MGELVRSVGFGSGFLHGGKRGLFSKGGIPDIAAILVYTL